MIVFNLLTAAVLAATPTAPKPKKVTVDKVWIALSEGPKGRATNREKRVKLGTDVRAWLVVEARVNGKRRYFSDAPKLRKGRRRIRPRRWNPAIHGDLKIAWYKVEADPIDDGIYDNTGTMEHAWHPQERQDHPARWHWCTPDYLETKTGWGSVWTHEVKDAIPTTTTNYHGLGTMRFAARVTHNNRTVRSLDSRHQDRAGLKPGLATVRFRRDDTPVGYMTELINVPYVYGSSSPGGGHRGHQAERATGVDCADLVVYGWRRAGKRKQGYTWTGGLKSRSKRRVWVTGLKNGQYRTADGRPIEFGAQIRVGDMLLWDRHVAVIATKDPTGYLTPETEILHTVMESPALVPLREVGFGFDTPPFDIRRARWDRRK